MDMIIVSYGYLNVLFLDAKSLVFIWVHDLGTMSTKFFRTQHIPTLGSLLHSLGFIEVSKV